MKRILMRVSDMADLYGVSCQAVYNWIHQGKVAITLTPGGRFRVVVGDIEITQTYAKVAKEILLGNRGTQKKRTRPESAAKD